MAMFLAGETAPDFELRDSGGMPHRLSDYRGKKVVLYFYPKDDTPGCTKEACAFRDDFSLFKNKNVVILGVSADSVESHKRFEQKFQLPFLLLSDPDKSVIEKYGAWQEKSMYGKTFMGVQRSTFVIDEKGRIAKVFPKVTPEGHSRELLEVL